MGTWPATRLDPKSVSVLYFLCIIGYVNERMHEIGVDCHFDFLSITFLKFESLPARRISITSTSMVLTSDFVAIISCDYCQYVVGKSRLPTTYRRHTIEKYRPLENSYRRTTYRLNYQSMPTT